MTERREIHITKEETEKAKSRNLFLRIWTDSVFSRLIASGILLLLPVVSAFVYKFLENNSIKDLFTGFLALEIKLYVLLILTVILILGYYLYLRFNQKTKRQRQSFLNQRVGNYRYGDLNNILLSAYIKTPSTIYSETGLKELDLLTLFKLFISYYSKGIDWDYPGPDGTFLYYELGPKLVSYGLCEMVPSLDNKTKGNINTYDIFTSEEGFRFFALLESLDRMDNGNSYAEEVDKKQTEIDNILNK